MKKQVMTWEQWREELRKVAETAGFKKPDLVKDCGEESWRPSFERGETPREAFDEQMSYD